MSSHRRKPGPDMRESTRHSQVEEGEIERVGRNARTLVEMSPAEEMQRASNG